MAEQLGWGGLRNGYVEHFMHHCQAGGQGLVFQACSWDKMGQDLFGHALSIQLNQWIHWMVYWFNQLAAILCSSCVGLLSNSSLLSVDWQCGSLTARWARASACRLYHTQLSHVGQAGYTSSFVTS
jgi:hypothetical protein